MGVVHPHVGRASGGPCRPVRAALSWSWRGRPRALINMYFGGFMKPLSRHGVNKFRSASKFRKSVQKTKHANIAGPMRGGIRL